MTIIGTIDHFIINRQSSAFSVYVYDNDNIIVDKMLNGYKKNLNLGFKTKIITINKHIDHNNILYPNYNYRLNNNNVLFNLCYYQL